MQKPSSSDLLSLKKNHIFHNFFGYFERSGINTHVASYTPERRLRHMPDSPCCCKSNPIEFRYAGSDPGRHGAGNSTASVVSGTRRWQVRAISPYLETGNVQALLTTWNLQGRAHCPVCVLKCLRWMKQTLKAYSPTAFSLPCKVGFTGCAETDLVECRDTLCRRTGKV